MRRLLLALAAICVVSAPLTAQEDPSVWTDIGVLAGGGVAYEAVANAVNITSYHEGRGLDSYGWPDLTAAPRNDYGCLLDNGCFDREWSHYVTWTAMGASMRLRGHDPPTAWMLSGVFGNLWWEYVVEGTHMRPSGRDLIINATSAAVGVGLVEISDAIF